MNIDRFTDFSARLRQFIKDSSANHYSRSEASDAIFNQLALELFSLQFQFVTPYQKLCQAKNISPDSVSHWSQIPSVPTNAFKELELTSLAPADRTSIFHSSGTTEQRPSRHFHSAASMDVYEASLLPWFEANFFHDWEALCEDEMVKPLDQFGFISLTPPPGQVPHSSLVHMFETLRAKVGSRDSFFGGGVDAAGVWNLDIERILFGIRKSMCANRPIGIVGTAFSFVHLLDELETRNIRYKLAAGSRVLETGGYKGRSRTMPKEGLHALITKRLGIPRKDIICEYGMSELSSQAYDTPSAGTGTQRIFRFPAWARVRIVSPETGQEVADGETGLIRIYDLANVRSVMAIQTEDLAVRRGDGFALIGRAAFAEPRGCSLMSN